MSTPCYIGYQTRDSEPIIFIQCTYDGFPESVGVMLNEYYNNLALAYELVSRGDVRAITGKIETNYFYHRDGGESWEYVKPESTANFLTWYIEPPKPTDIVQMPSARLSPYRFLFKNGKWHTYNHQGVEVDNQEETDKNLTRIYAQAGKKYERVVKGKVNRSDY
jgi:hypothetical protein